MRGPGEPVAPSGGYGMGSYNDSGGTGQTGSMDYASMIPDPALRQSFSQNVEEVRALPLLSPYIQCSYSQSTKEMFNLIILHDHNPENRVTASTEDAKP